MEEKEAWEAAKADYESGIEGVGMALKVLRDYYAEKEESLLQTGAQTHTRVRFRPGSQPEGRIGRLAGKLVRARSRPYQSQLLKSNTIRNALRDLCTKLIILHSSISHL